MYNGVGSGGGVPSTVLYPPPPSSIGPEERHLLCSLAESAQFAPAVKACFDRQWVLQPAQQQQVVQTTTAATSTASNVVNTAVEGPWRSILAESVSSKQSQIRQICAEHYGEFLAGIEHLLSVKLDLSELRALAQGLNASVQASGRAVVAAARALNEQRRIRYQLNSAQQILQSCASLLALARKAKAQIRACKYFSALKTLHQLQRILHVAVSSAHKANQQAVAAANAAAANAAAAAGGRANGMLLSPTSAAAANAGSGGGKLLTSGSSSGAGGGSSASASAVAAAESVRFDFLRQLERQIPLLTGKIKDSVKAEFGSWLGSISRRSQQLGELALSQLDDALTAQEKRRSAARKKAQQKRMHLLQRKAASVASAHAAASAAAAAAAAAGAGDKAVRRTAAKAAAAAEAAAALELEDDEEEEEDNEDEDGDDDSAGGGNNVGVGSHSVSSLFDALPLNFSPVYECLHIYEHLNLAASFQTLYKEKRMGQLMDTLHGLAVLGAVGGGGPPVSPMQASAAAQAAASPASSASPTSASASSSQLTSPKSPQQSPGAAASKSGAGAGALSPASSRTGGGGLSVVTSPASPSPSSSGNGPSSSSPLPDLIETYTSVLTSLSGFFVVEDAVLKSGNELMSRAEVDTAYEKACLLLVQYLSSHMASLPALQSPPVVLQLKYVLVLFKECMESGAFLALSSPVLSGFLADQRARFEALLLAKFRADTRLILAKEKWEPLGINDAAEYALFVQAFHLAADGADDAQSAAMLEFPCTMPFSIGVPLLARAAQHFIDDYFVYARYLEEGSGTAGAGAGGGDAGGSSSAYSSGSGGGSKGIVSLSWKAHVQRAVDRALGEVNRTFMDLLGGAGGGRGGAGASASAGPSSSSSSSPLPISQTVQISINAQVLSELTCPFLERYIEQFSDEEAGAASSGSADPLASPTSPLSPGGSSGGGTRLAARGLLLSTKLHCEDLLFELIGDKLDAFLELGESESQWTPEGVAPAPSEHVRDAVAWLETILSCMSFMPDAVREAAHFTSCKRLADALLAPLVDANDPRCKKFNIFSIANLAQDLRVLESFAQRCPIQNLVEVFAELRQLVDLLLLPGGGGGEEFEAAVLDPRVRAQRFGLLSNAKLIRCLDKFKDLGMFSMNVPPQYKKLKRKNTEAVVKKLRQMQQ